MGRIIPLVVYLAFGENGFVFVVDDLVGFAFGEGVIDIFDGLEPELAGISGEIEVQLLGFEVGDLDKTRGTKVLLRWLSSLS